MRDVSAIHFDDRDDAEAFVESLTGEDLTVRLHREEFAGEDDAEDAAWIVEVHGEVPELAHRAEGAGGWLVESSAPVAAAPPPLPAAPKRVKNPPR